MRGAGLVLVLCWLILIAMLAAYALSVDLAATIERITP